MKLTRPKRESRPSLRVKKLQVLSKGESELRAVRRRERKQGDMLLIVDLCASGVYCEDPAPKVIFDPNGEHGKRLLEDACEIEGGIYLLLMPVRIEGAAASEARDEAGFSIGVEGLTRELAGKELTE